MRTIVVSQMGGLGDVVLASRIVASVKEAHPAHSVHLVCRDEFVGVADLFPVKPDSVSGISLNPYHWTSPDADLAALLRRTLKDSVATGDVDLFLAAEYQPTWFSFALAAWLKPKRALAASHIVRESYLATALCRKLQLDPVHLDGPITKGDIPERERHRALLEAAGIPFGSPEWKLTPKLRDRAAEQLSRFDLRPQDYLICFPLGAASIPFKRWPRSRFLSVLRNQSLPVLFTGTCDEDAELSSMAAEIGLDKAKVFVGRPDDLPVLAGVAALARAYLGNDTGTMHLAAAYGVPGVAIFGGGHWPVYVPSTRGAVSVVSPLPCFGCDWDCAFGRGLCVEGIPEAAVQNALAAATTAPGSTPQVVEVNAAPPAELALVGIASARYREAARERDRRLGWIVELQENLRQAEGENHKLRSAADERLEALRGKDQALESVRSEAERVRIAAEELTDIVDARDSLIDDLEQLAAERLDALETASAAHRAILEEAEHRADSLQEMSARMALLEQECDARLKALEEANSRANAIQREAHLRGQEMQRMGDTIRQQQSMIAQLAAECEIRLNAAEQIRTEAERRASEMSAMAAEIERLELDSNARLQHLDAATVAAEAIRREADLRSVQMVQMAETIRAQETLNRQISNATDEIRFEAERRAAQMQEMSALIDRLSDECELRMTSIVQLGAALEQSRAEIQRLTEECDARLVALEQAAASNDEIRTEADRRAAEMQKMSTLIERLNAECDLRLKGFERASANEGELLKQVEQLRSECDARLVALEASENAVRELRAIAEDRATALAHLRSELESRESLVRNLGAEMEALKQSEILHRSESERLIRGFEKQLADAQAQVQDLRQRTAELESKYRDASTRLVALHSESLYNFVVRRFGGNREGDSPG